MPLLGVVENMSSFCCPNCGTVTDIFRKGGGERLAEALGAPFLGAVPLDAAVVDCGDDGTPLVRAWPDSAAAAAYRSIAARLADAADPGARLPSPFAWPWEEGAGVRAEGAAPQADGPAQPLALERRRDSRTLGILWADGARQSIDVRDLRLGCPCAACGRDERPPPARPCNRLNIEPTRYGRSAIMRSASPSPTATAPASTASSGCARWRRPRQRMSDAAKSQEASGPERIRFAVSPSTRSPGGSRWSGR